MTRMRRVDALLRRLNRVRIPDQRERELAAMSDAELLAYGRALAYRCEGLGIPDWDAQAYREEMGYPAPSWGPSLAALLDQFERTVVREADARRLPPAAPESPISEER